MPARNSPKYTTNTFLSIIALKKGWITGGSSNPNIAQTARVVLTDYTTGKLVFCHIRPDYDKQKHGSVVQAGFNLITIADEPLNPVEQATLQNETAQVEQETEATEPAQTSEPTVAVNNPVNNEDDLD
jgi:hypothetical protein